MDEMLARTSTERAPWHILESVDKRYARIKAMRLGHSVPSGRRWTVTGEPGGEEALPGPFPSQKEMRREKRREMENRPSFPKGGLRILIFTAGRALVGESAVRVVGVPEQDLVAGLVLLGVAAGGGAGEMTKGADEMGVVGETGQLPRPAGR